MRVRWFVLLLGAAVIALLMAFPLWWPLLNSVASSDPFPGIADLLPEQQALIQDMAREDSAMALAFLRALVADPDIVPQEEQSLPEMQGAEIFSLGSFTEIDAIRRAEGTAIVYEEADGTWLLRLEDFAVSNGPELHVLLSANPVPETPEDVMAQNLGIDLGLLKGTQGSQNYPLPARLPGGEDMSAVRSVVIYSVPYETIFSSAQLIRQ